MPLTVLGWGSNVLPSDAGVSGLVVMNLARGIAIEGESVTADAGAGFGDVFLRTAQHGLTGLEFAVGIPGSLGGALVSNAGAYRSEIGRLVEAVEIADGEGRRWVEPGWMGFRYRDSRFRNGSGERAVMLRVRLGLKAGDPRRIYDAAREYQRQRIGKQPPSASAGSFFKNHVDQTLAQEIEGLTPGMRESGVIPAGFLLEACGLKGLRLGGAMIGRKHANYLLNVAHASATELRSLAEWAKLRVHDRFGVRLEEECLYLGDWTGFVPIEPK